MSEDSKKVTVKRVAGDKRAPKVATKAEDRLENETERVLTHATEAERVWDEIHEVTLEIFSLPNQSIEMHTTLTPIEPSAAYLTLNSPAVLPALEKALEDYYTLEHVDRFIKVTRKGQ